MDVQRRLHARQFKVVLMVLTVFAVAVVAMGYHFFLCR